MTTADDAKYADLHALAKCCGVQTTYYDIHQQQVQASPHALMKVFTALGVPIERAGEARDATREYRQSNWRRLIEPVAVAWEGQPASVAIRIDPRRDGNHINCRLELEDGRHETWSCDLEPLPAQKTFVVENVPYLRKTVTVPHELPWGYHQLIVKTKTRSANSTIISAPMESYDETCMDSRRAWGVFLPLYALHSNRSWGAGDLTDLERLLEWVTGLGGNCVGTLPLMSAFLDELYEHSPYAPVSRLMWNEFYADPLRTAEYQTCAAAQTMTQGAQFKAQIEALRSSPTVDYRQQMALKRKVLAQLAASLPNNSAQRKVDFDRFVRDNPAVEDYARFRAVCEKQRTPWQDWTPRMRDGELRRGDYDDVAVREHLYAQWVTREQIGTVAKNARNRGADLYLDLPLGVHPQGYDTWRYRSVFAHGVSGGAPPDQLFKSGQDWGFAPMHPERMREDGYRYFTACVRHQLRYARWLRIDHVMSLHRMFWVPQGMDATDGVYVRHHPEEMYAVLSLESHRHGVTIIGEDLGTVPQQVRKDMGKHGVWRMYVGQFELGTDPGHSISSIKEKSIASLNTHDTPTFGGMWDGVDIDDQRLLGLLNDSDSDSERSHRQEMKEALVRWLTEMGLLGESTGVESVVRGILKCLGSSRAGLVLANLEDLWQETQPQNVPGTSHERPNWLRKARFDLETFTTRMPKVAQALRDLNDSRNHRKGQGMPVADKNLDHESEPI